VQLLHFSDWHGQLDSVTQRDGTKAGGAAVLRAYFVRDRAAQPNTLTTTGGDEYGATPPLSSLNAETPSVLALNLMGLQVSTLGNHNFDRGITFLQQKLGEAAYTVVSTNLGNLAANGLAAAPSDVVAPFHLETVGGVKVAFIGISNLDAPTLSRPGNMGTLTLSTTMADAATSAHNARVAAAAQGAEVFVVLTHMGITARSMAGVATGPLVDLVNALSPADFDVVLGDHTNFTVNEVINGIPTVECLSTGVQYARVLLDLNPATHRPTHVGVTMVTATLTPDIQADLTAANPVEAMLAPYRAMLSSQLDPRIGEVTDIFPRGGMPAVERVGEAAIGNLVADSMFLSDVLFGAPSSVDLAIVNGGGCRSALPSSYAPVNPGTLRRPPVATTGPYDLVRGDVYSVLPFGNGIVWLDVTGAQVWGALEQGINALPAANGKFPQVSGLTFTYDVALAPGSRIISIRTWGGVDVLNDATQTFKLATSDFMFYGGDGYTMLTSGTSEVRPQLMAEALEAYIVDSDMRATPITPAIDGREAPLAGLVINEVNQAFGSTADDLVELLVVSGGNTLGLTLEAQGLAAAETLAVLPDLKVDTGDVVVVHLFTTAQLGTLGKTANRSEENTKTGCVDAHCYASAWDVAGSGTQLVSSNRVVRLRDARGSVRDLVAFTDGGASPVGFPAALQAAQTAGRWMPANCGGVACTYASAPTAQSVCVDWSSLTANRAGNSVQRKAGTNTMQNTDWKVAPQSFGVVNP
jgi:5'-nucleotidase